MTDVVDNLDNNAQMVAGLVAAKDEIFSLRKQAKRATETIDEKLAAVTTGLEQAGNLADRLQTLQIKVDEIQTATNTQKTEIDRLLEEIQTAETAFTELRDNTQEISDDLEEKQADAKDKYDEIDGLHDRLLVDDKDDQGKVTGECTKTRIDNLETKIEDLLADLSKDRTSAQVELAALKEQLTEDFAELKKTLKEDIHKLLPEAGAAGLSSAYFESKSVYGPVPCASKDKADRRIHFIKGALHPLFNYFMLIAPLAIMSWLFFDLFKDIKIEPSSGSSSALEGQIILLRVLIATPLGFISWFGWSSISLSRRLYEEYNHKQRVMQLYRSFTEEIDKAGTHEQKQALLSIMLKTVADKPALVMKSYEMSENKMRIPFISKPEKKTAPEGDEE